MIFLYICGMKYLVRAIKYFAYLAIILCVFLFLLSVFGLIGNSLDEIFKDGSQSLLKIGCILLIFAAIYPKMGFTTRKVFIPGAYGEIREGVVDVMHDRGYVLEAEEGEDMKFRIQSPVTRVFRMFEDRITFTRTATGFDLEGPAKDLVRVVSALEYKFRQE